MTRHDPDRGEKVLDAIEGYQLEHGYAPSIQEIAERLGLASKSTVYHWVRQLERQGRLLRDKAVSRSLRVVREPRR